MYKFIGKISVSIMGFILKIMIAKLSKLNKFTNNIEESKGSIILFVIITLSKCWGEKFDNSITYVKGTMTGTSILVINQSNFICSSIVDDVSQQCIVVRKYHRLLQPGVFQQKIHFLSQKSGVDDDRDWFKVDWFNINQLWNPLPTLRNWSRHSICQTFLRYL